MYKTLDKCKNKFPLYWQAVSQSTDYIYWTDLILEGKATNYFIKNRYRTQVLPDSIFCTIKCQGAITKPNEDDNILPLLDTVLELKYFKYSLELLDYSLRFSRSPSLSASGSKTILEVSSIDADVYRSINILGKDPKVATDKILDVLEDVLPLRHLCILPEINKLHQELATEAYNENR